MNDIMKGYSKRLFSDGRKTHAVYEAGAGPAVILIQEIPHISPALLRVAAKLQQGGFSVSMPSLIGTPQAGEGGFGSKADVLATCLTESFQQIFDHGHSDTVVWLRALVDDIHNRTNGPVGIVGLCFSGGFALAAATQPSVRAAVACEPSLPIGASHATGVDREVDIAKRIDSDELAIRIFKFQGDPVSPCERVESMARAFQSSTMPGNFAARCLNDSDANPSFTKYPSPHSVITNHLVEGQDQPTSQVLDHIIGVMRWRLAGAAQPDLRIDRAIDCSKSGCARAKFKPILN